MSEEEQNRRALRKFTISDGSLYSEENSGNVSVTAAATGEGLQEESVSNQQVERAEASEEVEAPQQHQHERMHEESYHTAQIFNDGESKRRTETFATAPEEGSPSHNSGQDDSASKRLVSFTQQKILLQRQLFMAEANQPQHQQEQQQQRQASTALPSPESGQANASVSGTSKPLLHSNSFSKSHVHSISLHSSFNANTADFIGYKKRNLAETQKQRLIRDVFKQNNASLNTWWAMGIDPLRQSVERVYSKGDHVGTVSNDNASTRSRSSISGHFSKLK